MKNLKPPVVVAVGMKVCDRPATLHRTCNVCGIDTCRDSGRCTNGRCSGCCRVRCSPGGDTSPGHNPLPPEGPLEGFRLVGEDGNAYAIIGRFLRCARRAGWSKAAIEAVVSESKVSDYQHLISTFVRYEDSSEDE